MAASVFSEPSTKPALDDIKRVSGVWVHLYDQLINLVKQKYELISFDWKFYSDKTGWVLQVFLNNKPFFLATPMKEALRISFIYSNNACNEILKGNFPEAVKKTLATSPKHTEGRSLRMDISSQDDLDVVKQLLQIRRSF